MIQEPSSSKLYSNLQKTLNLSYVFNRFLNLEGFVKSTTKIVFESASTSLSYVGQPSTLLAYAITEFLPITNIPFDVCYFAFDNGSYIAFDDGSSIIYLET